MNFLLHFFQEPLFVWGFFVRCLGLVYFIAISQLYWQVIPIAGAQGINPVSLKLKQIKRDFGPVKKWVLFPTLLWLNNSDRFLKGLIILGSLASLVVIIGGPLSFPALIICWLVYLSLDIAVGFSYPWDCVLLEMGFLSLWLPAIPLLPDVSLESTPHPALAWTYRFLLFRLIFGFGKFKFWKSNLRDQGYFRAFMVNIPLPSYVGWLLSRFPSWFFLMVLHLSFLIEILIPPLIFFEGYLRVIAALLIIFLMIAIWLVSNFGFFNLVTIVLCIPLFDVGSSIFDIASYAGISMTDHILIGLVVLVVGVGGLLNFIFNSWCTFTWLHWPSALQVPLKPIRMLLGFYRAILRFRITHSYGVFPKESIPPIKWVPIFEGSLDGIHWKEYEYKFMATNEYSKPRFVAPYHPRLDHAIFYDAYGTNDANFSWSLIGGGIPYEFTHRTSSESIMQRLLEGNKEVIKLFRKTAFGEDTPPKFMRVFFYRFQPVSLTERRNNGKWWIRKPVGTHLPARTLNSTYYAERETQPELFHWDAVFWKDATTSVKQLQQTAINRDIDSIYQAAIQNMPITIDVFWDEFLPFIEASEANWDNLSSIRSRLINRYDFQTLKMFEMIWGRLSLQMEILLRPYFLKQKLPASSIDNYFIFGLYIHHIIGKGKHACENIIRNTAEINTYMADFIPDKAFYYYAVFWYDTLVFQSRKIRLAKRIGSLEIKNELPGFVRVIESLSTKFEDANEEQWPYMYKNPVNGEWIVTDTNATKDIHAV